MNGNIIWLHSVTEEYADHERLNNFLPQWSNNIFRQRMNILSQKTKTISLHILYASNVFPQQTNISPQLAHKY